MSQGIVYNPVLPHVETVGDDHQAKDSVAAWLALELDHVDDWRGKKFFSFGVPCRRRMTRAAETRPAFVDDEYESEAVWPSEDADMSVKSVTAADRVEEREVSPAQYAYECPRVLAFLRVEQARWAYETFTAVEFDSMYRLRDNAEWTRYVEELRDGMEKS